MLGLGFGAALLISLFSDEPEPSPADVRRSGGPETGLAPAIQSPSVGWKISHASWIADEDESDRFDRAAEPDPRAEQFNGMAIGVVR